MTINFSAISEIFSDFIKNPGKHQSYEDRFSQLVFSIIGVNKTLWNLEDSARLLELGDRHVAEAKKGIDLNNQDRNNLIREVDIEISKRLRIVSNSPDKFYSESPGMIIDRLSIIFLKLSTIQELLSIIREDDLKTEYKEKEKIILNQIKNIGQFYDRYIDRLINKEVFFEIQQPVKIYNDERVKGYIKMLKQNDSIQ